MKMSNDNKKKQRGRPRDVDDRKLKEIALKIKAKFKGQKLTFLLLEKETGIGRQTWSRRIADYIEEINKPIIRPSSAISDDIYFPNIEEIFTKNNNNKSKIINELHEFELMFRNMHKELSILRVGKKELEHILKAFEKQRDELIQVRNKAMHYEFLYKKVMASSAYSHLRENLGFKNNLIEFSGQSIANISLEEEHLAKMFPKEQSTIEDDTKEQLATLFPDLFADSEWE